ncbi:hypothetical protein [Photobacterium leiognathi]|uniref:hypothetical protein n=1 Tax=Photobacterium leiognathi TaxID=553611 RepID=UPI002981C7FF|nr:hypothetical protein [Photobacterium leiognathi]
MIRFINCVIFIASLFITKNLYASELSCADTVSFDETKYKVIINYSAAFECQKELNENDISLNVFNHLFPTVVDGLRLDVLSVRLTSIFLGVNHTFDLKEIPKYSESSIKGVMESLVVSYNYVIFYFILLASLIYFTLRVFNSSTTGEFLANGASKMTAFYNILFILIASAPLIYGFSILQVLVICSAIGGTVMAGFVTFFLMDQVGGLLLQNNNKDEYYFGSKDSSLIVKNSILSSFLKKHHINYVYSNELSEIYDDKKTLKENINDLNILYGDSFNLCFLNYNSKDCDNFIQNELGYRNDLINQMPNPIQLLGDDIINSSLKNKLLEFIRSESDKLYKHYCYLYYKNNPELFKDSKYVDCFKLNDSGDVILDGDNHFSRVDTLQSYSLGLSSMSSKIEFHIANNYWKSLSDEDKRILYSQSGLNGYIGRGWLSVVGMYYSAPLASDNVDRNLSKIFTESLSAPLVVSKTFDELSDQLFDRIDHTDTRNLKLVLSSLITLVGESKHQSEFIPFVNMFSVSGSGIDYQGSDLTDFTNKGENCIKDLSKCHSLNFNPLSGLTELVDNHMPWLMVVWASSETVRLSISKAIARDSSNVTGTQKALLSLSQFVASFSSKMIFVLLLMSYLLPIFSFTFFIGAVIGWFFLVIVTVFLIPLLSFNSVNFYKQQSSLWDTHRLTFNYLVTCHIRPFLICLGVFSSLVFMGLLTAITKYFILYLMHVFMDLSVNYGLFRTIIISFCFLIVYSVFYFVCCYKAMKLVYKIPNAANKWLGLPDTDRSEAFNIASNMMKNILFQEVNPMFILRK